MSIEKLENKLNYRAWKLMEATRVPCFCRFSVINPSAKAEEPVQLDGSVEKDKTPVAVEPPYEMLREQEAWFYEFHRKF
jgi:hypothetical protein